MPRVTLQAYAEEHRLKVKYAYDEYLCKNRKIITGFSSFEDVFKNSCYLTDPSETILRYE